ALKILRDVLLKQEVNRGRSRFVRDLITKRGALLGVNWFIERNWIKTRALQTRNLLNRDAKFVGQFIGSGVTAELMAELGGNPVDSAYFSDDLAGQTDRLALVCQRPLDCPLDPPTRVSAKADASARIKSFNRLHQPNVSLRNQIA